jgi:hypothetical protein
MFFENKLVLALDMDDNLCNTQEDIIYRLIGILTERKMTTQLHWVMDNKNTVSTMLYPEELRNIITEDIIKTGQYIHSAKPTCLVGPEYELSMTLARLKIKFGDYLKTCICTHRGERPGVMEGTAGWLKTHRLDGEVKVIHSINPSVHRNKVTFLKATYPGHRVLLLDDNPFGDLKTIHPYEPSVLVYDKLNNFEAYQLQNKYQSREHLDELITSLITTRE